MRVGVVAGTASPLPPGLAACLAGCERILHAGGIGDAGVLERLARLAPVSVVIGDRDFLEFGDRYPESAELELGGARVLLTHMVGRPPELLPPVRQRLGGPQAPDVVVYGQGAEANVAWDGGTLLFHPGAACPGRPGRIATCGVLDIDGPGSIVAHVLDLARGVAGGGPYDPT
ncbi:MAG: metallophosphoesterase family protein [Acidobacteria bacterium]|nr:metallophosphoesterase family protein [Acidobacteriota bacterium]